MIHLERSNICAKHCLWLAFVHQKSASHLPNLISSQNSNQTAILILRLCTSAPSSLSQWHGIPLCSRNWQKKTLENSWRLVSCDPVPGSVCAVCPGTTWRSRCQQVAPHGLPQRGPAEEARSFPPTPRFVFCLVLSAFICILMPGLNAVLWGVSDVLDKNVTFCGNGALTDIKNKPS